MTRRPDWLSGRRIFSPLSLDQKNFLTPPTPPVANPAPLQKPPIAERAALNVKDLGRPFLSFYYRLIAGIKRRCRREVFLCTATDSSSPL